MSAPRKAKKVCVRCGGTPEQLGCPPQRDDLHAKLERYREVMMEVFPASEGFTEAFDTLRDAGLLVAVQADALFRAEWGDDEEQMYVWEWLAHEFTALTDDAGGEG